jgi:hypothetical protein
MHEKCPSCYALKKMQMRMAVRAQNDVIEIDGSDASSEDEVEEPDDKIADWQKKKGEWSICNMSFSNFDLANLVNGWPDDPVELHLFD